MAPTPDGLDAVLAGDPADRSRVLRFVHDDPHRLLGPHAATVDGVDGTVVRAHQPDAVAASWRRPGEAPRAMTPVGAAGERIWAIWLPGEDADVDYRLTFEFADGGTWERQDPYRFPPTLGDVDLFLFAEGTHQRLWEGLGARRRTLAGVEGWAFSVWAPNARRVSLVGEFCGWDGRLLPMRKLGDSGVFDLFVPGLDGGEVYKFEILGGDGAIHLKADPMARWAEAPPATASRTFVSRHVWGDADWTAKRRETDVLRRPMATYEVHLGSWRKDDDGVSTLGYRELARRLVEHVETLGFDTVELLPVAEHPFDGSWGYQVSGYYAPTARYGDPDDFRFFVDLCHQHGIAVVVDWVPGHFVKDAHALGRFDGTALYEHADPRQGLHPDWDTYIFNLGRHEVLAFLLSNALYWLEEFHVDGLRVDAVASMLYLDYSRKQGEWIANRHGGRENLDAIAFLQRVNQVIHERHPGCFTVAEESTAWPKITQPASAGGLGFDFKWNMGWMHDTLSYFKVDPLFRSGCQDQLTFAMIYEHSEHFLNPLSHDEVVHGKGSLYAKMPGDPWRKLANLRTLLTYQLTRPGKKLLFMGSELASTREWNHETSLDWYLLDDPDRGAFFRYFCALGKLYRDHPCLWSSDPDPEGFQWIACWDRERSVVSYERRRRPPDGLREERDDEHLVVVLNLTPMPRERYRLGAPRAGKYRVVLSSDAVEWGGSGYPVASVVKTQKKSWDGYKQSMALTLPPLAAVVLKPVSSRSSPSGRPRSSARTGSAPRSAR